jgi:RecA-family ATPase
MTEACEPPLPEIPDAVAQEIVAMRRLVLNARADNQVDLFKRSAVDLWRVLKISATVNPDSAASAKIAIADALYDIGAAIGLDDDTAQHISATAASARDEESGPAGNGYGDQPSPQLTFLDPTQWEGRPVPPRRWLVPHRLPLANVTMLNGDGSAGKTTIALQLVVATIRGTDWLGSIVDEPGPAIFFTAEEDKDEIHRRLAAIAEHQAIGLRDLARLHILCMPGSDTVLGIPDRFGVIHATPLFESLYAAATTIQPTLIVIEAVADVFAGNENDRAQVRQFIALLRRLALTTGAAVMLIAHPSLSGLASGSGTSGSTAWNNSVRSRLYFTGAKKADDDAESDIRELKVMKSNYGPVGEVVRLRWQRGVFVPEGGPGMLERIAAEAAVDQAYLDCLDAAQGSGREVGEKPGKAYAPTIFAKMPQAKGYRSNALAEAQERLFSAGRIHVQKVGSPSKALGRIFRKAAQ